MPPHDDNHGDDSQRQRRSVREYDDDMDRSVVKSFMERFEELASGAAAIGALAIADRSGLLEAMAGRGPVTIEELAVDEGGAERFAPRYVEEILATLAGPGSFHYEPATARFLLPDEHAACLADPDSPYSLAGWLDMIPAAMKIDRSHQSCHCRGGWNPICVISTNASSPASTVSIHPAPGSF